MQYTTDQSAKRLDDMPLVSVVLPTHNRAKTLSPAIHSVLRQTYTNLELIVVDDASEDDTRGVVRSFNDARIRYVRLDEPRRASGARNVGIQASSGQFLAFLDDDDIWLVCKIERQLHALLNAPPEVGLNLCGYISLYRDRTALYIGGKKYFSNVQPENGYAKLSLIATPGWLVRAEALSKSGLFDERIQTLEDWELSLRLSEHYKLSHLEEPLYLKSCGDQTSLSKSGPLFSGAMQMIVQRHAGKWQGKRDVTAFHFYLIGRFESNHHSVAAGRRWLRKAIGCRPFYFKAWLALMVSWLGQGFTYRITKWSRSGYFDSLLPSRMRRGRRGA